MSERKHFKFHLRWTVRCLVFIERYALHIFTDNAQSLKLMNSLASKHALITGGSSGIGLACALQLLKQGAHVTLLARNRKKLCDAVDSLKEHALNPLSHDNFEDRVSIQVCDVSDSSMVHAAVQAISMRRPIDVLVCSAGTVKTSFFEDSSSQDIENQVKTNLMGTMYAVHAVLPSMKLRSKNFPGAIAIICSLSGLSFWYGAAVYTATKYGQRGFAEALRLELLTFNIKVSLICPSFTDTPLLDVADNCDEKLVRLMKAACAYDRRNVETTEHIAECTVKAVKKGTFLVTTQQPVGGAIRILSRGFFPPQTWAGCIAEVLLSSPLRFLSILASRDILKDVKRAWNT